MPRAANSPNLPVGAVRYGARCSLSASRHYRGLGLIELLTIVAVLAIALAFMVSMARHVRSTSANELTRKRMQAIAEALNQAALQGRFGVTGFPSALRVRRDDTDARRTDREVAFQGFALTSSRHVRDVLLSRKGGPVAPTTRPSGRPADASANPSAQSAITNAETTAAKGPSNDAATESTLPGAVKAAVSNAVSDAVETAVGAATGTTVDSLPDLNDAWGRPIALMPGQHSDIGMAPDDGPFLVSAGPDGRFLTLADNVYSYDVPVLLPAR